MMPVNKQAIAAAFGRAAQSYSQHDELQRLSAQGLLAALGETSFAQVLDAGCGPGSNSRYWRGAGSQVTAIDLSARMLEEARQRQAADRYLLADIEAIPLADAQFDLVWSHLAVQCAAACRRPCASFIAWRDRAGRWRLPPCWKVRCRS